MKYTVIPFFRTGQQSQVNLPSISVDEFTFTQQKDLRENNLPKKAEEAEVDEMKNGAIWLHMTGRRDTLEKGEIGTKH